jgi:hypothetical protein
MASTTASLQALDELRQQAVASQGTLPTAAAAAAGQQGGGLFGGLLPDMDNLKDPGMNVIVDSIMQHLLSKEVLQQPMRVSSHHPCRLLPGCTVGVAGVPGGECWVGSMCSAPTPIAASGVVNVQRTWSVQQLRPHGNGCHSKQP